MESFLNVRSWLIELEIHVHSDEETYILVGNKADLETERQVPKEKGKQLADKYGLSFIEASALTGKNVSYAFSILSQSKITF